MSRKNPFKGAIVLTSIAAVLVGLFFLLEPYFEESEKQQDAATLLFGGLDRNEIFEIRLQRNDEEIFLKKSADKKNVWTVSNPEGQSYTADTSSVNGILSTIIAAREESEVANVALQDAQLTPPKHVLELSHGVPAQKKILLIGKDTPVDYLVYGKWSESDQVFLTSRSLRFGIDKSINDLRNKKVFNFHLAELKSFEMNVKRKKNFENIAAFNANNIEGDWHYKIGDKEIPLLASELASFVTSLKNLSVQDFVSEKGPADYREYRLHRPIFEFSYTRTDNPEKEVKWLLSMVEKDNETRYYLAQDGEASIYEVSASLKDTFDVEVSNFRDGKILELAESKINHLRIEQPNKFNLHLHKDDGKWVAHWEEKKEKRSASAKAEVVEKLIKDLTQLQAKSFFDTQSPRQLRLHRPQRIVEIGAGDDMAMLFFGRLRDELQVINTERLVSPAGVEMDLGATLPTDINFYADEAKDNRSPSKKKGTKVKLEATVEKPSDVRKLPAPITKAGHKYTATMKLSNDITLEMEFDSEKAPYTVSNFLHLARNKFYDDVVFHRVIADFVIQGGDPTGYGRGGPGYKFDNEDNDLKHLRGSLSMAHAGRDTNGSQFFIVLQPQPHLDGLHTVFGKITQGTEVLDNIPQGTKMVTVEVFEEAL